MPARRKKLTASKRPFGYLNGLGWFRGASELSRYVKFNVVQIFIVLSASIFGGDLSFWGFKFFSR